MNSTSGSSEAHEELREKQAKSEHDFYLAEMNDARKQILKREAALILQVDVSADFKAGYCLMLCSLHQRLGLWIVNYTTNNQIILMREFVKEFCV